jgi:DNA polymerase-3 subunit gamma/tau
VSYEVFARKYRPQTFDDLVGQAHVSRTLKNAVAQNRLAHAYLFVGPRGIGKTSTARILAKSVNCVKGPTVTPCGKCDNCLEITAGNSLDVIEIDGASNRGIDDVRELRDNVRYAPAKSRLKIYIIDEVHMLTKEAFNALLKSRRHM